MRKKSHILLAKFLADQMTEVTSLQEHRKAFCLGSVLPDIRPSFITKRHEFFGTFDEIQEKIKNLVESRPEEEGERAYWRRLGEVLHYIADYFTFPHNKLYTGNFFAHNKYEKGLKEQLEDMISSGKAQIYAERDIEFESFEQLILYLRERHACYLRRRRNLSEDIQYILTVCYQVIQGIFHLCTDDYEKIVFTGV